MIKTLFRILLLICSRELYSQYEVLVSSGQATNTAIKKFDETGTFIGDFATNLSSLCPIDWTQDIIINPHDNTLLISSFTTANIFKFNIESGECLGVFADVNGVPTRMKIGKDNLLYVLQWVGNGKVLRFYLDGTFKDEFTETGVTNSIGLDWDKEGNLLVSSYNNSHIRKFDKDGKDLGLFISTNLQGPTNIWFNDQDELFVLNWDGNRIKKFDSTGNLIGNIGGLLSNPEGVAFLPNGNFLVGNGGANGKITEYTKSGSVVGTFASGNNLSFPNAIFISHKSNLTSDIMTDKKIFQSNIGNSFLINSDFVNSGIKIFIRDLDGRLIRKVDCNYEYQFDASLIKSGLYIASIISNNHTYTQKIVINN